MNLIKNRSRNYINEGNGYLFLFYIIISNYNIFLPNILIQKRCGISQQLWNPKNNLLFGDKILKDLKSTNIIKKNDNNKSETSRNTNKPNHSFYESHYSNGINKKLDKIDLKITIFKKEITKEILKSQTEMKDALLRVLGSISNSMKQLIDGQNKLIKLAEKK